MQTVYWLLLKDFWDSFFANQFLFGSYIFGILKKISKYQKKCVEDDLSCSSSSMTTVQPTIQWLKSSLYSPQEFRIPFESSRSKTSLPSSSPSATPWPWPPRWPRGYWGRLGPGPGPHIYFIVWTFQIGRAAAGTGKGKICLFKTSVVCWAEQDVEALWVFEFCHNLSFWVWSQLRFVTIWGLESSKIVFLFNILSQFEFEFHFNLSF